jgi:hypothetical protein
MSQGAILPNFRNLIPRVDVMAANKELAMSLVRIEEYDIAQSHYLQEDVPRKEIDLISQVGDLSLRVYLNLLESL